MSFKVRTNAGSDAGLSVGWPIAVEVRCAGNGGRCGRVMAEVYVDGTCLEGVGCNTHGMFPFGTSLGVKPLAQSALPTSSHTMYEKALRTNRTQVDPWTPPQ